MKFLSIGLLCAALCLAAAPEGKWVADAPGINGTLEKTIFDLYVQGEKITGSVVLANGTIYPVERGAVKGDDVSFFITVKVDPDTKMTYAGKIAGQEIRFTHSMEGAGSKTEFVAKPLP